MNTIESISRDTLQERGRLADFQQQIARDDLTEKLPCPVPEAVGRDLSDSDKQAEDNKDSRESSRDQWSRNQSADKSEKTLYSRLSVWSRFLDRTDPDLSAASTGKPEPSKESELDEADKEMIQELRQRDQEVRLHEQAHAASLGPYAGSIAYTYQMGPDGVSYAIGGSTEVRPASGNDSASKAEWARLVRHASLAAGHPSAADASVAAAAAQMETAAHLSSVKLIA